jgi:20S proteasome alpha/beta subunit
MTIALGILSNDGVVIAADSQVTVPGYLKLNQGKVSCVLRATPGPVSSLMVSGAGAETSISYMSKSRMGHFGDEITSAAKMEAELEKQIREYHERHVTPHGTGGVLDVWMIVGSVISGQKSLWVTDKSVCVPQSMFGAVGAGEMYAKSLLGKMYAPMNTLGAILLASYVISEVKQLIDGCGNDTDIVAFRAGKFYYVDRKETRELEQLFQQRYSRMEVQLLHETLRNMGWDPPGVKLSVEALRIRKELARIVRRIESPAVNVLAQQSE